MVRSGMIFKLRNLKYRVTVHFFLLFHKRTKFSFKNNTPRYRRAYKVNHKRELARTTENAPDKANASE